MARILASDLSGRGKPHYAMWISLISAAVSVGLASAFTPMLGIAGAAGAAAATNILMGALFLWAFRKESGSGVKELFILKKDDVWTVLRAVRRRRPPFSSPLQ